MLRNLTRTRLRATSTGVLALVAGVVLWQCFLAPVDEKYFQPDYQQLRTVAPGVFVFRPTRYGSDPRSSCIEAPGLGPNAPLHLLGRNVTITQAIAMAYQCELWQVVPTLVLPTNHYDFLVTARPSPAERLQSAIARKFDCNISKQERATPVWRLKTTGPDQSVLKPSSSGMGRFEYHNGELVATHLSLAQFAQILQANLKRPVTDATGLKGEFDFTLRWNWNAAGQAEEASIINALQAAGLGLEPDSEVRKVFVVGPRP